MRYLEVKQCKYFQNLLEFLRYTIVSKETQGLIQREQVVLNKSDLDICKYNINRYRIGFKSIQYLS